MIKRTFASSLALLSATAYGEPLRVADNNQVLAAFAQATGSAPPDLIKQEDGGTKIEWRGGVSFDRYNTTASGGNTLNPRITGGYYRLAAQGDLRDVAPDGRLSWLQFGATGTDDRSVQRHATLINTIQAGHSGQGYLVAGGDVNVDFSTLGTRLGVRGLLGQKYIGQTLVSTSVGTLTPTWNDVWARDDRSQYLRNVASLKIDTPFSTSTRGFLTVQGYDDDSASLAESRVMLAPTSGRTETIGIAYQKEQLSIQGELGLSHWQVQDQGRVSDHALVLDGTWAGNGYGIRAGHHNLGLYYTSLSTQAAPGIVETYLGGNWQVAPWVGLQGDLRHSENKAAGGGVTVLASAVNSGTFSQSFNFGPNWPGWGAALTQTLSDGELPDGGTVRQSVYGGTVNYANTRWSSAFGYSQLAVKNNAAPAALPTAAAANGTTDIWTLQWNRLLSDNPAQPSWTSNLGLNAGYQDQQLDNGTHGNTRQIGCNIAASKLGLGTLNMSYIIGWIKPTTGGADLKNQSYAVDIAYPFYRNRGTVKAYVQDIINASGDTALKNTTHILGAQVALTF